VINLDGGIRAWDGLIADGPPESGYFFFGTVVNPGELIPLAFALEEGSRLFYLRVSENLAEPDGQALFSKLAFAEEKHENSLRDLYKEFIGAEFNEDLILTGNNEGKFLEGGILLDDAIAWTQSKSIVQILEFSIALETNAYDLYLRMMEKMPEEKSRKVFDLLVREERLHLESLSVALEKRL